MKVPRNNTRLVGLEGPDYYPTPEWGTRALLDQVRFEGQILEPACGEGYMSRVLEAAGYDVVSSDLHPWGFGDVRDFFSIREHFDNMVTNPPYNRAEEFLRHALTIIDRKICLLMRLSWLESEARYHRVYKLRPPTSVYVFTSRLSMYRAGYVGENSGATCYAWYCWDQAAKDTKTTLDWLPPVKGKKEIVRPTGSIPEASREFDLFGDPL
jgi:hypothetical protein